MTRFHSPDLTAPPASIVGIITEGICPLASSTPRIGARDALPQVPGDYILDQTFATADGVTKARAAIQLAELRAAGASIVLISSDQPLLESCADEIWWIADCQLIARGDPGEVLAKYRAHVAAVLRADGEGKTVPLTPAMRKGDGRARLEQIELLGENGQPTAVWRSGEAATIAVTVRFAAAVADPVIGIMIRTRVGLNVYGTNTELERLTLGPVAAGDVCRVTFRFTCDLCPGQYTVTAASHDPDGLWHDWLEDAVAFAVADERYTAGVANLRAQVAMSRP